MADKYSTIQQHQPLRIPEGWDKQEKALIVQLDEIFDDIYRRFGRLRLEDMNQQFRNQIADDEGNISQLIVDYGEISTEVSNKISKTTTYQTADSIVSAAESYADSAASSAETNAKNASIAKTESLQSADAIVNSAKSYTDGQLTNYSTTNQTANMISAYVGNNAYGKVSGIQIVAAGIDISGSQYLKLASGGYIQASAANFLLDTKAYYLNNVLQDSQVMVVTDPSTQSAVFYLKMDGTLYSKKLTAEDCAITGNSTFQGQLNAATGTFAGKIATGGMEVGNYGLKDANAKAGVYLEEVTGYLGNTYNNILIVNGYTTPNDINRVNTFKIGYHEGRLSGTQVPSIGNNSANFDIGDRTHPVNRAFMNNIVPGSGNQIRMWLAGYDSSIGNDTRSIDFYRSSDENYIVSPANPNTGDATGHIGTVNDPMKDGHFEELYIGGESAISLIVGMIGNLYTGGESIAIHSNYNCTTTDRKHSLRAHIVCNHLLVISGRIRLIGITRTGSTPGVKIALPTGYRIRVDSSIQHQDDTDPSIQYQNGTNSYSDSGRFGEANTVVCESQATVMIVCVSETYGNVIDGKDLIINLPMTIIPIEPIPAV